MRSALLLICSWIRELRAALLIENLGRIEKQRKENLNGFQQRKKLYGLWEKRNRLREMRSRKPAVLLLLAISVMSEISEERTSNIIRIPSPYTRRSKRNAAFTRKWPLGIIPYTVSSNMSDEKIKLICKGMSDIEAHSCIKYTPIKPKRGSADFVYVSSDKDGCFASVGYRASKSRPSKLNLSDRCFTKRGIVEHELLHLAGLFHEHSRPDRDKYIKIDFNNIKPGHVKNFNMEDQKAVTTFDLPYDPHSVMHYSNYAFSINDLPTIIIKNNGDVLLGQREGPSNYDFLKIYYLYDCNETDVTPLPPFETSLQDKIFRTKLTQSDPSYISSLFEGNSFQR